VLARADARAIFLGVELWNRRIVELGFGWMIYGPLKKLAGVVLFFALGVSREDRGGAEIAEKCFCCKSRGGTSGCSRQD